MATKKDLIEAQGFSRRRLLSAFVAGAPGGKELDPAKPLRAVVAGIALSAMVILAGVFYGLISPGLPADWENNRVIVATDTGARYVAFDGTLYPVINAASARLLIPASEYTVLTTTQNELDDKPIGPTIGILGAPDDLPLPESLLNTGWTACVDGGEGTYVSISDSPLADPSPGSGAVVRRGTDLFVIAGGLRHQVPADQANAVLRAAGLGAADVWEVEGRWLNLFSPGDDLAPVIVPGAGERVSGTDLTVGTIVRVQGDDETPYAVMAGGELAPLSPLAHQLYLLGTGSAAGAEIEVTPAELAALPTGDLGLGTDWPREPLAPLDSGSTPCAVVDDETSSTVLGSTASELPDDRDAPEVSVGGGALVSVGPDDEEAVSAHVLIDASGTAFAVPDDENDLIARLGYGQDDIGHVSNAWIQFFAAGPTLTLEAAGRSPSEEPGE